MSRKIIALFFIVLSAVLVSGCTQGPDLGTEYTVVRTLSPATVAPGEIVTVKLSVNVGSDRYYAIDDVYPSGWEVVDKGEGSIDHSGHWKYVIIADAVNTEFTYTIKAPNQAGTHTFGGEYMFASMEDVVPIKGQGTLTVQ